MLEIPLVCKFTTLIHQSHQLGAIFKISLILSPIVKCESYIRV